MVSELEGKGLEDEGCVERVALLSYLMIFLFVVRSLSCLVLGGCYMERIEELRDKGTTDVQPTNCEQAVSCIVSLKV